MSNPLPPLRVKEFRAAHSGNYTPGRNMNGDRFGPQEAPSLIVIHVADGSYDGTLSWFTKPECDTSAHFTVGMMGEVGQSVSEQNTAWHSGKWWTNVHSFGIEHEGQPSKRPWYPSEELYQASAELTAYLCMKYRIPADRNHIIGHSEVDPDRAARARCPGSTWNWTKYIDMVNKIIAAHMPPKPAHEGTSDNRAIRLVNDGGDKVVGSGTLIAGTDKVYIKDINLASVKLGTPKLDGISFRNIRIFNASTNKQVGTGVYLTQSDKVYIVTLNYTV